MLKPYFDRAASYGSSVVPKVDDSEDNVPVLWSSLMEESGDAEGSPSRAVIVGRLNNSEMLAVLPDRLRHLTDAEESDILNLVQQFPEIFSDIPKQTHVCEHDIDVGTTAPIKQHPYRVNPLKRNLLKKSSICLPITLLSLVRVPGVPHAS